MRFLPAATAACLALAFSATIRADEINFDASAPTLPLCRTAQNNVRFLYNAWNNGARDTYAEMKAYMRTTLKGKGEKEEKLLAVYEGVLPHIENGDWAPPKVNDRVSGINAAKQATGTACLAAFDGLPKK